MTDYHNTLGLPPAFLTISCKDCQHPLDLRAAMVSMHTKWNWQSKSNTEEASAVWRPSVILTQA